MNLKRKEKLNITLNGVLKRNDKRRLREKKNDTCEIFLPRSSETAANVERACKDSVLHVLIGADSGQSRRAIH